MTTMLLLGMSLLVLFCLAEENVCVKPADVSSMEQKYSLEKEELTLKINSLEAQLKQSVESAQASADASDVRSRQTLDEASEVLKDRNAKLQEIEKLKRNLELSAKQVSEFQSNLQAAQDENRVHVENIQQLKAKGASQAQIRLMEKQLSELQEELAAAQRSLNLDVWLSETYDVVLEQATIHLTQAYITGSHFAALAHKHSHLFLTNTVKPQLAHLSLLAQQVYDTHCREAVTPLLEEAQPHLDKYLPVATQRVDAASLLLTKFAQQARERFQLGRELLKQKAQQSFDTDKKTASVTVDVTIGVLLAPLVVYFLPKLWGLLLFCIGMSFCCFCCGFCRRKRRSTAAKSDMTGTTPIGKKTNKTKKRGGKGK